jgi:hypothetical protein
MMLVIIKCKCGELVMCELGEYQDGDLIQHSSCKLKEVKENE